MKRSILLVVFALLISSMAYADIFKPVGAPEKLKATEAIAIPGLDAGSLLAELTQGLAYLSPADGPLLDKHGVTNYLSATIISFPQYGLSVNAGTTGTTPDGAAATVNLAVGKYIPAENVPLLQYIQNATIGVGGDYRQTDRSKDDTTQVWSASWAVTGQIKTTF